MYGWLSVTPWHKMCAPLFLAHLQRAAVYFEYGGGESTRAASACAQLRAIYSVQSSPWHLQQILALNDPRIEPLLVDLGGDWPGYNHSEAERVAYSEQFSRLRDAEVDLVLINGTLPRGLLPEMLLLHVDALQTALRESQNT